MSGNTTDASNILVLKKDQDFPIQQGSALNTMATIDSGHTGYGVDPLHTATQMLQLPVEHVEQKTQEFILSCKDCGVQFDLESDLTEHISKGACEFRCGHCSSKFSSKQQLQGHIRMHMQILPFSCNMCSREFSNIKQMREHKSVHKVDKLANIVLNKLIELQGDTMKYQRKCFICGKVFTSYFNLKRHLLKHKSSGIEATLKVLEQVQKGQSHFGMLFFAKVKSLSELALNTLAVPVPKKKNAYNCRICKKGKFTHFSLKRHLEYHFDNRIKNSAGKQKQYKCNKCSKKFKSASLRDLHQEQIHDRGVKVYSKRKKDKKQHKQHLTNENLEQDIQNEKEDRDGMNSVFTCTICEKEFATLSNLEKHVDLHKYHQMRGTSGNGIRKYKCTQCPNSYSLIDKLNQHIDKIHVKVTTKGDQSVKEHGYVKDSQNIDKEKEKINSNQDLLKCKYCNRLFQNGYNLGRHEKLHQKGNVRLRPFSCEYCHKTYAFQSNLRLHILEAHKNVISVDDDVILEEKALILREKMSHVSLVCSFCGDCCSSSFNLRRHERRWHSEEGVKKGRKRKR